MNNLYEYCLRISSNFSIEYVSQEFSSLLNNAPEDLMGLPFFNCFQLTNCLEPCDLKQALYSGKPQIIHFTKTIDTGKKLYFKSLCKPVLSDNNELLCVQKFIQNISDLIEVENKPIESHPPFMH